MTPQKSKINFAFFTLNFKLAQFLLITLTLLIFSHFTIAADINNIYGIHLAQPHLEALEESAKLVNSQGGDWGYVTLVIQEDDRKIDKWQEIFNRMRKLHLIPIIRLATVPDGSFWRRPSQDDVNNWVDFLDSLNWVVKNRYIVLFNEPNHGSEWGSKVDAKSYAQIVFELAKKLKERNKDFFVMLAGFDASAPHSPPNYEDEEIFLQEILNSKFQILNYIDGWSSHSYPNPNFSGSPWASGRGTVRSYDWELRLLERLGVNKKLPVFITETGWKREVQSSKFKVQNDSEQIVANNYKIAFENVWSLDDRIAAVTPFVLDYQSEPFLEFSWKRPQSNEFYEQYRVVQSLPKIKGQPKQIEKGEILINLPKNLVALSNYQFKIKLKNFGQAVWDKDDGYKLQVIGDRPDETEYLIKNLKDIFPFEEKEVELFLKTDKKTGERKIKFILEKDGNKIIESARWLYQVEPLPSMDFKVNLFPKLNDQGDNFEIQIFDEEQKLIFKKNKIEVFGGKGKLIDIQNIVLGQPYRVVILKPGYLPRQEFISFAKEKNFIKFKIMIPFDFNRDGRLSLADLLILIKKPSLLQILLP